MTKRDRETHRELVDEVEGLTTALSELHTFANLGFTLKTTGKTRELQDHVVVLLKPLLTDVRNVAVHFTNVAKQVNALNGDDQYLTYSEPIDDVKRTIQQALLKVHAKDHDGATQMIVQQFVPWMELVGTVHKSVGKMCAPHDVKVPSLGGDDDDYDECSKDYESLSEVDVTPDMARQIEELQDFVESEDSVSSGSFESGDESSDDDSSVEDVDSSSDENS